MPNLSAASWRAIRERYEQGDRVKDLAAQHRVTYEAIRRRASTERWHNPRRIAALAREKLLARDAALGDHDTQRLMSRYIETREHISVAALLSARRFRERVESGEVPGPADWREITNLVTVMQKAVGVLVPPPPAPPPAPAPSFSILDGRGLGPRPQAIDI